ncbi:MAG: hypothetical protein A2Y65_12480 [Deltaproteobacteria bacterium RBG_13_52_11]|nr:MAG: hypothetical protein A2Y65_12480 [Deltaproteobacteria bacterium RBG_13_52_11]
MRKILCLLVLLTIIGAAAYGQAQEQAPPFAIAQFDKDRLLNQLAVLTPFLSEKGGAGLGYAFSVKKEEFRDSLALLAQEKTEEMMKDFGMAVAFSFKDNTQFLVLTQWRDHETAKKFIRMRDELWRLTDEKYKSHIKNVAYEELEIAKDEKALLTRKTIEQAGQKQDVTTFVSARKDLFFECTLMGNYNDSDVKKLVLQIWKIVESEAKKGSR